MEVHGVPVGQWPTRLSSLNPPLVMQTERTTSSSRTRNNNSLAPSFGALRSAYAYPSRQRTPTATRRPVRYRRPCNGPAYCIRSSLLQGDKFSASEVTTLWRYTNLFIIIIIIYFLNTPRNIDPLG